KPGSNPHQPSGIAALFSSRLQQIASLAVALFPLQADVGCELASNLIAQPQARFRTGQARANVSLWVVLSVQIQLQLRRENPALGEQYVVFRLQAQRSAP